MSECSLLTGRRVVWSLRCPQSSLQVEVGGAEEGAKAGLSFPQGGPPQLEALLLECLKIPTEKRWKKNTDLETKTKKTSGGKGNKICGVERNWHKSSTNWERVGRREGEKMRGMKGEGRRWRVEVEKKQVRCQLLWHTNTAPFSDGCLKGTLKCYPTLNLSLFIIQQKCPHTHRGNTHQQVEWMSNTDIHKKRIWCSSDKLNKHKCIWLKYEEKTFMLQIFKFRAL